MHPLARYYKALWAPSSWSGLGYLFLGLPLSIVWFVYTVTMLAVGASLVVVWVGLPLLVMTVASLRWIGAAERGLANGMIRAQVEGPGPLRRRPGVHAQSSAPVRWGFDVLSDPHAWRVAAWTGIRIVLGPVGFAAAVVAVVVPVALLGAVVQALALMLGLGDWMYGDDAADVARNVGFWVLMGAPVVFAMMPMFMWAARGLVAAHRPLARWALGPSERDRAEEATARAELAEEQVRIDQELHDSIGHMITMNVIQAGAGAHVFDTDPEFARQALKNIEERGRAAMGELDRIIATIRGDQPESRAPLPGMREIVGLVEASRAAGMNIEAAIDPPTVPDALGRAAFGMVREALTNAAKHAPGATASVRVGHALDALTIAVINGPAAPGARPASSTSGGRGVAGMRDRIALLGGKQHIGPTGDGGFEVLAILPLGASIDEGDGWDSWWERLREKVTP